MSGLDSVKPASEDSAEWLSSADLAESALLLNRYGVEFDRSTLGEISTEKNAVETFVKLYEGFAGSEVDTSTVTVAQDDKLTQKALLLDLIEYFGNSDYYYDENAAIFRISSIASTTLGAIERDVFGRQSETVTGEEFAAILRAQFGAMRVHESEDGRSLWSDLGKVDIGQILGGIELTGDPFNRRDAAELLERITKEGPVFAMKYSDHNLEQVEDARESIWVRRAVTHGFMNYYGNSVIFAPWEGLTLVNAISTAKCYFNARYNDWAYSRNYEWDGSYTNEDVVVAAAKVAEYFDSRTEADREFEVTTVINDRDYDWFFSQKNTGEYSAINCMPSIATMASHWYDRNSKATVRKMRATSDYNDGWTAYELRSGLAAYDVPYTVEDASFDNIIKALDEGKIVLAQYSDRKTGRFGVSGHCYVIYGYRKFKNSATFIVNDSDSLTERAKIFGRKMGNGDEVEGSFSVWTITRFVSDITVVGSDSSNN